MDIVYLNTTQPADLGPFVWLFYANGGFTVKAGRYLTDRDDGLEAWRFADETAAMEAAIDQARRLGVSRIYSSLPPKRPPLV